MSARPGLQSPWRWLALALFCLALLALVGQLLVYVDYTAALLRFPFDYDQGEGFELYDTVLHAQGQWPYQDSQVFPFYTSIYPPVFHLMTVPLVWLFGPQMWTGRLMGFLASLVTAGAIACAVHRHGGPPLAQGSGGRRRMPVIGILSGLAFLASNYTFHIGPLFRQHMTMVMFETVGIVLLAAATDPEAAEPQSRLMRAWRRLGVWPGILALVAAGFSKPLALPTVLAGFAFLFLRGPRRAVLHGLGAAALAGGLFLCINWITHGWFYTSVVAANINAYDLGQAISLYRQWLGLHLVLAALALARLVHETYFSRLSVFAVWFVFALANGISAGKFGAGESYFVTTTAAACALGGVGLSRLWERAGGWSQARQTALALIVPVLFLIQARLTLHLYTEGPVYAPLARLLGVRGDRGYYDSQGYTQLGPKPTPEDHAAGWAIAERARRAPGPVFSEEAGFMFAAGKPVVTNPFPQLVMYQAGIFDPAQEIAMITDQAFGLVILRAQFYPPPVLQALGAHYQPLEEIRMNGFTYRLLVPRHVGLYGSAPPGGRIDWPDQSSQTILTGYWGHVPDPGAGSGIECQHIER